MAAGKTKHKALWLVLGSFIGLIILVIAIIGGKYYMEKQRATQLYQHGFKLYEEQIATYIKEHYSGVRKIEFSPILFRRGGMSNAHIEERSLVLGTLFLHIFRILESSDINYLDEPLKLN